MHSRLDVSVYNYITAVMMTEIPPPSPTPPQFSLQWNIR